MSIRPRKFKKPALIGAVTLALVVAVVVLIWRRPERCPYEATLGSLIPAQVSDPRLVYWAETRNAKPGDLSRHQIVQMTLIVRDRKTQALPFTRQTVEARTGNDWVRMPNGWLLGNPDGVAYHPITNSVALLISKGANACRLRLTYPLQVPDWPLGIGKPGTRYGLSSSAFQPRAEQIVQSVSPRLYRRLWPQDFRFKTAVIEVNLTNLSVEARVQPSSISWRELYK